MIERKTIKWSMVFVLVWFIGTNTLAQTLGPAAGSTNGRSPKTNYKTECQGCHLPDGRGMASKVPTLRNEIGNFLDVEGGRAFIVRVPGTANSKLSDADIARLLNWLIIEMGPAPKNGFAPYTEQEVSILRSTRLTDVKKTRKDLVAKFNH